MTLRERIRQNVSVSSTGCWEWQRRIDKDGYGQVSIYPGKQLAHRASYEVFVGPIEAGMEIDHLCRVRHCVNPAHLEQVTRRENQLRGDSFSGENARKTHCASGHPFDALNTYWRASGHRDCRACVRDRVRRYKQRLAA